MGTKQVTARNEFEVVQAWTVITGSSQGGFSDREMAADIIEAAECTGCARADDIDQAWRDLAKSDDESIDPDDWIALLDGLPIPESCCLQWHDNELVVTPYIDPDYEFIPRFDETPDEFKGDIVYVVNDHGNVTCYRWNGSEYQSIWEMV